MTSGQPHAVEHFTTPAPVVSIVVPCYCEEEMLAISIPIFTNVVDNLIREGNADPASELILVDDGSMDRTWRVIECAHADNPRVKGVRLSSNRGQSNATFAGLESAQGDFVITIDSDLQDDVAAIRDMVLEFRRGVDIVYGVRRKRTTDTFFKRTSALAFYRFMEFLGVDLVYNHSEFRGMSRRAVDALRQYREKSLFLSALVRQMGFRTSLVYYDRAERLAGKTKYSFGNMLTKAVYGVTSFSFVPLRLVTLLGLGLFCMSGALIVWILGAKYITHTAIPGWASMLVVLTVFGGMQLFCLGIIGEYLAVIFNEVKDRPRFHIEQTTDSGRKNIPCGSSL